MKIFWFIFLMFIFVSGLTACAQEVLRTLGEKKVISLIAQLPEVIINNKYSLKKYRLPLVITVDSDPTKDRNYYSVSVYFDRRDIEKLNNLYHFEVDAKTYAIGVWDIAADKVMSLKAWRKQSTVVGTNTKPKPKL